MDKSKLIESVFIDDNAQILLPLAETRGAVGSEVDDDGYSEASTDGACVWSDEAEEVKRLCREADGPVIVLVDMDNTLVDWEGQFHRLMREHHPEVPLKSPDERRKFYIEQNYPDEYRETIVHLNSLDDFWRSMEPVEGGLEAMKGMRRLGLEVYILTAPDQKHTARSALEKVCWVEERLGLEWKARTIMAQDKTLVRGDVLIDDKPTVAEGLLTPSWTHLLFHQPYNVMLDDGRPRLRAWSEWLTVLRRILISRSKGGCLGRDRLQEERALKRTEGGASCRVTPQRTTRLDGSGNEQKTEEEEEQAQCQPNQRNQDGPNAL